MNKKFWLVIGVLVVFMMVLGACAPTTVVESTPALGPEMELIVEETPIAVLPAEVLKVRDAQSPLTINEDEIFSLIEEIGAPNSNAWKIFAFSGFSQFVDEINFESSGDWIVVLNEENNSQRKLVYFYDVTFKIVGEGVFAYSSKYDLLAKIEGDDLQFMTGDDKNDFSKAHPFFDELSQYGQEVSDEFIVTFELVEGEWGQPQVSKKGQ